MYLKSIEVHGFKSFANKIIFKFHDGITAIVGPNGSGKSNVADAVRWVLGEQSAKQLRGSRMEDVIFSGTQLRKPMGYAYVAITMDNSDHKLPIDYEEVTVARRVYRSGESEYLINGNVCRLRDVQELFLDTGIGKEGYSIIGQGQIDKILSGKPEDRRELFDEAAGIVKYKKRKAAAEKELAEEQMNLSRITDILLEIEKQVEPLGKQAEVAKEYLHFRDALRHLEINLFLLDYERSETTREELKQKEQVVTGDMEEARRQYDDTKQEYERLEGELERYTADIETRKEQKTELLIQVQRREGEIKLMQEKISSLRLSDAHFKQRSEVVEAELAERQKELENYGKEIETLEESLSSYRKTQTVSEQELAKLRAGMEKCTKTIEECNQFILQSMNQDTDIKTKLQHFETLAEQDALKKSELTQKVLVHKSEEARQEEEIEKQRAEHGKVTGEIAAVRETLKKQELASAELRGQMERLAAETEKIEKEITFESSKLETLRNLTERYDGYGNSIRKVMEQKETDAGIVGVVADIIQAEAKYETAIETALGASIQNIVTKDEATAKRMVEFLKKNKFGRATFLPLTAITARDAGGTNEQAARETGVIGFAHTLVRAETEYAELIRYLLGRILVVDTMDHALALAKKYHYSLRIVTLEGEQLNPGGSISGGAYKNNSNLLGRRREMEEIGKKIAGLREQAKEKREIRDGLREKREELRAGSAKEQERLQELVLLENTVKLGLSAGEEKLAALKEEFAQLEEQVRELEIKSRENKGNSGYLKELLEKNAQAGERAKGKIEECSRKLEEDRALEQDAAEKASRLALDCAGIEQKLAFAQENDARIRQEITKLAEEKESLAAENEQSADKIREQEEGIEQAGEDMESWKAAISGLEKELSGLEKKKEEISKGHKNFFARREELSERINVLDKEAYRLNNQLERMQEAINNQCNYMWEEYEITLETAKKQKDEAISNYSAAKKEIGEYKAKIKALGDVNVNAIEDFKNLSERYELYTTQRTDLMEAEAKLRVIIEGLDEEMRKQFTEKFAAIREQFDVVFKELFGGGQGTLELMEDEDVLTAGIRIIAQPPGKKLQNMMQLSGGEKALTAIALLFAIQNLKPSPFCLLDEIEAALDDSNVGRYAKYLHKLTSHTQFIVITHRRGTMAAADILYGITMQEKGVSTLVSVSLIEDELDKQ